MHIKIKNAQPFKREQGFSLMGLLVAIPLGLLVLFAVLKIFISNIQAVNMENAFSRVQENGRMAIEMLSRDIRRADYWGCANNITAITNHLSDPSALDLVLSDGAIEGVDVAGDNGGPDILTLRSAVGYSNIAVSSATSTAISISAGSSIQAGDIVLLSDCEAGEIFSVSSISSNQISFTSGLDNSYSTGAQIFSPVSKSYYIAESASGDGVSSLYRRENGIVSEVVRGISNLVIMYGQDTNGDGLVDTYFNADNVTDMNNVQVIRVRLVSESGNGLSGTHMQRTYTVTSNIRNHTLK